MFNYTCRCVIDRWDIEYVRYLSHTFHFSLLFTHFTGNIKHVEAQLARQKIEEWCGVYGDWRETWGDVKIKSVEY